MSSTSAATSSNISTALIAEMEQEAATTRKCLERIPPEKFDFKPHEKSMPMRTLAVHVAEMFGWTMPAVAQDELDFAKFDYKPAEPSTTAELVEILDKNVAEALEAPDDVEREAVRRAGGHAQQPREARVAQRRHPIPHHRARVADAVGVVQEH